MILAKTTNTQCIIKNHLMMEHYLLRICIEIWVRIYLFRFLMFLIRILIIGFITRIIKLWICLGDLRLLRSFIIRKGLECFRGLFMARLRISTNLLKKYSIRNYIINNSTVSISLTISNSKMCNGLIIYQD